MLKKVKKKDGEGSATDERGLRKNCVSLVGGLPQWAISNSLLCKPQKRELYKVSLCVNLIRYSDVI